jgi:hypothetical protein
MIMNKKIISTTIAGITLISILITGCARGNPKAISPSALSPSSSASAAPLSLPPATSGAAEADSGVMQSTLPLKISEPADAAELNTDSVAVKGQTVPGAAVNVNDTAVVADASGNFSATINLDPGPNAIDVIASDDSGSEGEVLILVNAVPRASPAATSPVDQAGLSQGIIPLQVTQPADSATLNTDVVDVKGKTAPGATVIINDQIETADANGDFDITVSLNSGPNVIDVTAEDGNGNKNEIMVMVNVVA